jgi:hypothetical protein
LRAAGFANVMAETFSVPVTMTDADAYRGFLATVVFGTHLNRLPDNVQRRQFIDILVEAGATDDPAFGFDYRRLNLQGQRLRPEWIAMSVVIDPAVAPVAARIERFEDQRPELSADSLLFASRASGLREWTG